MANFKTFSRITGNQIVVSTIYDDRLGKSFIHTLKSNLINLEVLSESDVSFPSYFRFDAILEMLKNGLSGGK